MPGGKRRLLSRISPVYSHDSQRGILFREKLKAEGIASVVYYPIPLHLQEALGFLGVIMKLSISLFAKCCPERCSLPMYPA